MIIDTFELTGDPLAFPAGGKNKDSICKEKNGVKKIYAFVTTSTDNSKEYVTMS